MARIRTIKPTFFASLSNADLPIPTRLTWIGLWTYVDDKGRAVDDARLVKAAIWPLDDNYPAKKVEADLTHLEKAGKIGRYEVNGERYLAVRNWRKHQRIDKPQPSQHPAAPWEESGGNDPGGSSADSRNDPGTGQESTGNDPRVPPSKDGGEVEGNGSGREVEGNPPPKVPPKTPTALASVGNGEEDTQTSEPKDQTLADALGIIAQRRHAKLAQPIPEGPKRRGAWLETTAANAYIDHQVTLEVMVRQGKTALEMADAIEPVVTATPPRYVPPDDEPTPEPAQIANGLASVRGALRSVGEASA